MVSDDGDDDDDDDDDRLIDSFIDLLFYRLIH